MLQKWLTGAPVAHRGLHNETIGENTMEAFENAIKHGYNIELDVCHTKDGVLVVSHDLHLKRQMGVDAWVHDLTYSEIKELRYLSNPNARIPLFKDVLSLCQGKTGLMVELKKVKDNEETYDLEEIVLPVLKDYRGDFIVKSFNPFTVDFFRTAAPNFSRGLLSSCRTLEEYPINTRELVKEMLFGREKTVDIFDYAVPRMGSPLQTACTLPLVIWTVTTLEEYNRYKDSVVNIIFEHFLPEV